MANPNSMHEPSMEEILASIRQIISEDGGSAAPKINGVRAEPPTIVIRAEPEPAPATAEDVPADSGELELELERAAKEAFANIRADEPEVAESPRPPIVRNLAIPLRAPAPDPDRLLSEQSGSAISGAFGALAQTLFSQNNPRSLEEVVTDMLQPMLKQWLDDNLPSIVERRVQEEIERVSRGRR